jgi:NADH-quinone oxidoreductase subunit C
MDKVLKKVSADLEKKFGGEVSEMREQVTVTVPPDQIASVCYALKEKHGFEQLAAITAVDYWPQTKPRFHAVYQFNSHRHNKRITLRVPLDGNEPTLPSVVEVYPGANWYERELWDMFGIQMQGHPDQRRILMPYDWEGHPLRKDYPLGYEEVQFTFNYEEIQKRKPFAEE